MLTYTIPNNLNIPLYQYIYECIALDIKNGKIKAGEKLPSKRGLAKQLEVSLITVETAYSQLLSEGYLYSIEKKGYFVNQVDVLQKSNLPKTTLTKNIEFTYKVDLKTSSYNIESFPFNSFSKITRKILSEKKNVILKPAKYNGLVELRTSIARHLNEYLGLNVLKEQIVVGSGSEHLYSLLIQYFGKKHYALEDPGYQSIASAYKLNNVDYSFIPLDEHGINIAELDKSKSNIVHVSTNHHFPTGITMPIFRRYELLNWAKENKGIIIEDDYDSELRLKGRPIPPLFALDENDSVIYLNTFSLTLSSSFRIAYMVLPLSMIKEYQYKMSFYHSTVPVLDQLILAEFIDSRGFERHLNRKKKKYREIKEIFVNELKKSDIYKYLELKEADSGLHLLIKYPFNIDDLSVKEKAKELGLNISSLSDFYHHKNDSHTLLVRYVSLDNDNVVLAASLLIKLFDSLRCFV